MVLLTATLSVRAESGHFTRLSVQDGLSQSSVESIGEDRYGFLWFGTQEGLNRFDGYRFEVHLAGERAGQLRDGFIRAIVRDPRGDLWIGTSSGLQHLDVATGRFGESVTPRGVGVRLNSVAVGGDGRVWFAGASGGLWTKGLTETVAQRVVTSHLSSASRVTAVSIDAQRQLWIAADGHLYRLTIAGSGAPLSPVSEKVLGDVGTIRVIHVEEGALSLGRQNATFLRLDLKTRNVAEHPDLPRWVLTIAPAGEGRIWVGGKGAGVTRFDPRTGAKITYRHEAANQQSLAEDDVAAIHQDRGGSLWVGAWNGGVSRLDLYSQAFRTLRSTPGRGDSLPDNDVTRMAEAPDGRLWAISRNDVLMVGDPATDSFARVPLERDLTAIAFVANQLFVGTTTGLIELDPETGAPRDARESVRAAGLDRASITALASAGGQLWILSRSNLYCLTGGTSGAIVHAALPENEEPTALTAAVPGRAWVAFGDGLLLRAETSGEVLNVTRISDAALTARGRLSAITEHQDALWIGAALGIGRVSFRNNRVEWLRVAAGMPSRSVAAILADARGHLWIPTERGITRFDPVTSRAIHFGDVQGAQSSGYVEGGAAEGGSGRFYFAGRGITTFNPLQVVVNPHQPRVVFTALEILHRPVLPRWIDPESPLSTAIHAASEVSLGPDAAVFSVEMAAPGASDPEGVVFSHRLDGFESEWIETRADRRLATYTRLSPGRYVIRARARTQSGVWSTNEALLRIEILPPWWRTPTAIALWFVLAAAIVALLVHEVRRRTSVRIALAEQGALRRASVTDPLTGLYNRRFLAEWLKLEIPRTLRTHHGADGARREFLLFAVADLDNLKRINDASGHDAGDRALRAVASLLQSHARLEDLAVRLGGDEFLLIVRLSDREQATQVVERLRSSASALDLGLQETLRSTISLGFATFPVVADDPSALTWEQTLTLADRALLHSKRRGRNTWSGFVAAPRSSAEALLRQLEQGLEPSHFSAIRVIEGPVGDPSAKAATSPTPRS